VIEPAKGAGTWVERRSPAIEPAPDACRLGRMGVGSTLIRTKLFVPPVRNGWLSRPRLLSMLREAASLPLTLISAGAGFGKTSLVSEWVERSGRATAWLSLDPADDDPARFWSYVCGALATVVPESAGELADSMQSDTPPDIDGLLAQLINRLSASSTAVTLVLDDLHVIEHDEIHANLAHLLRHCPPQLRLIVTTREDPPWPLSRLRAGGQVREIRARDLRFSLEEASLLLETTIGQQLGSADCEALVSRTEGWVVGLHMAAMSLRATDDVHSFVSAFSGSHRFVLDYLAEEVLAIQDERTRQFLVRSSVLDRFCAGLCDAALDIEDSRAILDELESKNLFVVPLDDTREWYRYHHLFNEYLRVRIDSESVEVGALHERASAWFEAEGLMEEAIEHALRAKSFERAATLLESFSEHRFTVKNQLRTVQWLKQLPREVLTARATLSAQQVWSEFVIGNVREARALLEQAMAALPHAEMPDSKRAEVQTQYDIFASWIAYKDGQPDQCLDSARRALERLGFDHGRPAALARLALACGHLHRGELDLARKWSSDVLAAGGAASDPVTAQVAWAMMAHADLLDGRLQRVDQHYRFAIQAVGDDRGPVNLAAGMLRLTQGEVLRERGDLAAAEALLLEGIDQCERQMGMPERVFAGAITLARTLLAGGNREEALSWLERAEALRARRLSAYPSFDRILWRGLLFRAALWLELGMPERVEQWLATHPPVPVAGDGGAIDVLRARVALLRGDARAALTHLGKGTITGDYHRVALERRVLRSKALTLLGAGGAEDELRAARELARTDGYRLLFEQPAPAKEAPSAERTAESSDARLPDPVAGDDVRAPMLQSLEALNEREQSILKLMQAGLSNSEIASELYLSVHTVKWHARNIYTKLDVTSRTRAIARAKDLGILR